MMVPQLFFPITSIKLILLVLFYAITHQTFAISKSSPTSDGPRCLDHGKQPPAQKDLDFLSLCVSILVLCIIIMFVLMWLLLCLVWFILVCILFLDLGCSKFVLKVFVDLSQKLECRSFAFEGDSI
ncbi:unnamed protein product [Vicia faba]|uniref:Transmembrane protein n=1 Tax=Vicia faba TaxID=3906 RepID=A0AAV0Z182_VICFA|nr:unnamed protein product [Vicia faba]